MTRSETWSRSFNAIAAKGKGADVTTSTLFTLLALILFGTASVMAFTQKSWVAGVVCLVLALAGADVSID